MATNNCPKCARSGVGACDDFPECQPKDPAPAFKYGDPVTVLTVDGEVCFIGIYVGHTESGKAVLVQHGDPHMEDPLDIGPGYVRAGWPPVTSPTDYMCATCKKEQEAAKS